MSKFENDPVELVIKVVIEKIKVYDVVFTMYGYYYLLTFICAVQLILICIIKWGLQELRKQQRLELSTRAN